MGVKNQETTSCMGLRRNEDVLIVRPEVEVQVDVVFQ
jgi:hypothetical protein